MSLAGEGGCLLGAETKGHPARYLCRAFQRKPAFWSLSLQPRETLFLLHFDEE